MSAITSLPADPAGASHKLHWLDSVGANRYIDVVVQITYWVSKVSLTPLRDSRYVALEPSDIVPGSRYVIAANHQSVIDAFMLSGQFPFRTWFRLRTLRSFLANYLFDNKFIRPLAISVGCFPAKSHPDYPYGLDYAIRQMRRGSSILIFPEGRRTIRGERQARRGVQVLAQEQRTMVIPVHLEWTRHKYRRSYAIGFGKPFDGSKLTPDEILAKIYDVPVHLG